MQLQCIVFYCKTLFTPPPQKKKTAHVKIIFRGNEQLLLLLGIEARILL